MHFEKTLDSETVYDGKIIKVQRDEVLLENGKTALREVVRHCDAVAVLALDGEKNAYFVRQFRYPIGRELFEVPAGKMEPFEIPLDCAKRELSEECGLTAEKWTELGPFLSSPGFCDETIWFFLAEDLNETKQHPDEDEFLDVIRMPFDEAVQKAVSGVFPDGKTQALILRAAAKL